MLLKISYKAVVPSQLQTIAALFEKAFNYDERIQAIEYNNAIYLGFSKAINELPSEIFEVSMIDENTSEQLTQFSEVVNSAFRLESLPSFNLKAPNSSTFKKEDVEPTTIKALKEAVKKVLKQKDRERKEKEKANQQWLDIKQDKSSALIKQEQSSLSDITHKTIKLTEKEIYTVKIGRRILKKGYCCVCMLDALRPAIPVDKVTAFEHIYQNLTQELQCLNEFAELFCFNVVTKKSSQDIDEASEYFYNSYHLTKSGWFKKIAVWVWDHFTDISELVGVALEFASSNYGVDGNTNAQNFETLQKYLKNPEKFEAEMNGESGYTQTEEALEAELGFYADGGQLATSVRHLVKQFDTPEVVEKLFRWFSLCEQTKIIKASAKFQQTLAALQDLDGLAQRIGLYIKQAQSLLDGITSGLGDEYQITKAEIELHLDTFKCASTTYINDLLPTEDTAKPIKEKLVIRRRGKRVRVQKKVDTKTNKEAEYHQIIAFEEQGMKWLHESLKVKCYLPPDKQADTKEVMERRLRLNRRQTPSRKH